MSNQQGDQSVGLLSSVRRRLRGALFNVANRMGAADEGRAIAARTLDGLLSRRPSVDLALAPPPYPDLGQSASSVVNGNARPIIVTARFRTGSTLLWHLFRQVPGCTSYYEPFNERRWFDPSARGDRVDRSHRDVEEYWREYDALGALGDYYQEDWIRRNLYMDETAWDPDMRQYVNLLINHAAARAVLQFNHVDFRLAWIRHNFPDAILVHLYRHPRDQWWSTLMDPQASYRHDTVQNFLSRDKFYLLVWATDLQYRFPFLNPARATHPYQLFYYIWRLSHLFGVRYAHASIAFEQLVADPQSTLAALFAEVGVDAGNLDALARQVVRTPAGRWRQYAEESWFCDHEAACDEVLAQFFS
jgi:hypothetical protein